MNYEEQSSNQSLCGGAFFRPREQQEALYVYCDNFLPYHNLQAVEHHAI
jgi:hypothetical protein